MLVNHKQATRTQVLVQNYRNKKNGTGLGILSCRELIIHLIMDSRRYVNFLVSFQCWFLLNSVVQIRRVQRRKSILFSVWQFNLSLARLTICAFKIWYIDTLGIWPFMSFTELGKKEISWTSQQTPRECRSRISDFQIFL